MSAAWFHPVQGCPACARVMEWRAAHPEIDVVHPRIICVSLSNDTLWATRHEGPHELLRFKELP